MKKFLFILSVTTCCTIFASLHPWDAPPKDGQLYMTYNMYAKNRILFVVTHYNKHQPIFQYIEQGWWDVKPQDILNWINAGEDILYCPSRVDDSYIDRIRALVK